MTKKEARLITGCLNTIQRWADGETIQEKVGGDWIDIPESCQDIPLDIEIRIKPKPREFWIVTRPGYAMDGAYSDNESAKRHNEVMSGLKEIIHVKEVL